MAGMFFSLKEAAERLGVAEDQVKQLVKAGKLREFRDGSNLLFKIDEVNALASEPVELDGVELAEAPAEEPMVDLFEEAPAEELPAETFDEAAALDESFGTDVFELDEGEAPVLEPMAEVEGTSELNLAPEETGEAAMAGGEDELLFLADDDQTAADGTEAMLAEDTGEGSAEATLEDSGEEISLAAESGVLAAGSDITDMDTALTGEGINVLEESSGGFNVTEDSMAETAVGPAGSTGEASLEEIEDDVNLDSFGSGSGLLDLSLQADDTSLGGILDEIYTSEGGEGEASDAEPAAIGEEGASFEDLTTEGDHAAGEEEMHVPEPVMVMPATVGAVYAEAVPDAQSNILGVLLFLPMLALLYTAIVAIGGLRHVTPSILSSVRSMIWYILGGLLAVALIVFAASFMVGREKGEAVARPRKEKKAKAEKPKKEKTAKAEKAAKAEKPAKGKKSFFGKKK